MDEDKRQGKALMRCSAIAPLITELSGDYPSKTSFFETVSSKSCINPISWGAPISSLFHGSNTLIHS